MRVTKHLHAALTVQDSGKTLVIDPGSFTDPLIDLGEVVAIVITHEHPDHWTPDHLDRILRNAPGIPIYGPEGVAKAAAGYEITVVTPGDTVTVEPFTLQLLRRQARDDPRHRPGDRQRRRAGQRRSSTTPATRTRCRRAST